VLFAGAVLSVFFFDLIVAEGHQALPGSINSMRKGNHFWFDKAKPELSTHPILDRYFEVIQRPFLMVVFNPITKDKPTPKQIIWDYASWIPRIALSFVFACLLSLFEVFTAARIFVGGTMQASLLTLFLLPIYTVDSFFYVCEKIDAFFDAVGDWIDWMSTTSPEKKHHQRHGPAPGEKTTYTSTHNILLSMNKTEAGLRNQRDTQLTEIFQTPGFQSKWINLFETRVQEGIGPANLNQTQKLTPLEKLYDQVEALDKIFENYPDTFFTPNRQEAVQTFEQVSVPHVVLS